MKHISTLALLVTLAATGGAYALFAAGNANASAGGEAPNLKERAATTASPSEAVNAMAPARTTSPIAAPATAQGKVDPTGKPEDLDDLWSAASIHIDEATYAKIAEELEEREMFFHALASSLETDTVTIDLPGTTGMTENEFYSLYSIFALRETAFLMDACRKREMRLVPMFPLPSVITPTTHPQAQLVSHYSPERGMSFITRLAIEDEPSFFYDRILFGQLTEQVVGEGGMAAETARTRTRERLTQSDR